MYSIINLEDFLSSVLLWKRRGGNDVAPFGNGICPGRKIPWEYQRRRRVSTVPSPRKRNAAETGSGTV